ncbi:hypothetical protein V6N11_044219 [Hibiscus sabdariffa]|uniref:Uncharacterized protein n=1 Tax=Hibiscus sabdariffa TaxID=183260 RepID=A0ABR2REL6_9ROSI
MLIKNKNGQVLKQAYLDGAIDNGFVDLVGVPRSLCFSDVSHNLLVKRTILSPFTKEYRVVSTPSGIRLFLEVCSIANIPSNSQLKRVLVNASNDSELKHRLRMEVLKCEICFLNA